MISRLTLRSASIGLTFCLVLVASALIIGSALSSWQITYRVFTSPMTGWAVRALDIERGITLDWMYVPSITQTVLLSPNRRFVILDTNFSDTDRVWMVRDQMHNQLHNIHIDNPALPPPLWSPDSTHIAYYEAGHIHIARLGHTTRTIPYDVVSPQFMDSTLTWSADGETLRFVAYGEREDDVMLVIAELDGTIQHEIPFNTAVTAPTWSSDGRKLAYIANNNLYMLDLDDLSAEPQFIVTVQENTAFLYWSPDDTQIMLMVRQIPPVVTAPEDVSTDVVLLNLQTHESRTLTTSQTPFSTVLWSPDSSRIAVINYYSATPSVNILAELNVITLMDNTSLSEPIAIDTLAPDVHWSPDSTQLLYHEEVTQQLMVINADGSDPHPVFYENSLTLWVVP